MNFLETFGVIIGVGILGGFSAGLLGVFVIGLRMPFIAVFSAHAAMAGAVFGSLAGLPLSIAGFAGALIGSIFLGLLVRKRDIDPNVALGSLFSLMMGLAFLGIGISSGPKSELLGLMWGSLLFVSGSQFIIMLLLSIALVLFVFYFEKELKLLLFSRELAALLIPEWTIFTALLIFSAGVITINLETVGGLLLYSLITNPAVAALRVARTYRSAVILSSVLGIISALGGFATAYWFNLPIGACTGLFSSGIVGLAFSLNH
ncbi:metal ABC transporter permease [Candidatus Latescibacterota bacterium]